MRRRWGRLVLGALMLLALSGVASLPVAWAMPHHTHGRFTVPTRTPTAGPTTATPAAQQTNELQPTQVALSSTATPSPTAVALPEAAGSTEATRLPGENTSSQSGPSQAAPAPEIAEAPPVGTETPDAREPVNSTLMPRAPSESGAPPEAESFLVEEVEADAPSGIPWMPGVGVALLIAGIVILLITRRR